MMELFADAELRKDGVDDVFACKGARDGSEGLCGFVEILGDAFGGESGVEGRKAALDARGGMIEARDVAL